MDDRVSIGCYLLDGGSDDKRNPGSVSYVNDFNVVMSFVNGDYDREPADRKIEPRRAPVPRAPRAPAAVYKCFRDSWWNNTWWAGDAPTELTKYNTECGARTCKRCPCFCYDN